jgi:hypothetical protein
VGLLAAVVVACSPGALDTDPSSGASSNRAGSPPAAEGPRDTGVAPPSGRRDDLLSLAPRDPPDPDHPPESDRGEVRQRPPPRQGLRAHQGLRAGEGLGREGVADGQGPLGADDLLPAAVTEEGFNVAPGGSPSGDGELVRYTVEVEPATGVTLGEAVAVTDDALLDDRSWAADVELERTDHPDEAHIRVLIAVPDTVDALCAEAGLDTEGRYSCWQGRFAALNSDRWEQGASGFDDLATYRRYLVNHEVGHGLGHGHVGCPAPGELAPVMMQQTISLEGCEPNGWPYPEP